MIKEGETFAFKDALNPKIEYKAERLPADWMRKAIQAELEADRKENQK